MLVEIKRICTQILDIPAEDAGEAVRIATDAASGMPEEDFNSTCSVVSLLPVKDIQLTFNWDET